MRFRTFIIAIACLLLMTVVLFWRIFTPQAADRFLLAKGDFTLHYYNFTTYQAERYAAGDVPLWNPYNYGGEPFAANIQRATFYPPRLLLIAVVGHQWDVQVYQFEVALHYWLAAVLMFIYLRVSIQHWQAALIGAAVFAFSGYMTAYPMLQPGILEAGAWLPLVLTGLHLAMTGVGWRFYGALLASLALCLSILAGHPQTTAYIAYLAVVYWLWLGCREHLSWITRVSIGVAIAVLTLGFAAIQLLPAIEFIQATSRLEDLGYRFNGAGFGFDELIGIMIPSLGTWSPLYTGTLTLFLGIYLLRGVDHQIRFWLIVAAASVLLGLGGHHIFYDVFYVFIPSTQLFRQQERVALILVFSIAVIISLVLRHYWTTAADDQSAVRQWHWGLVAVVSAAYLAATLLENEPYTLRFGFLLINVVLLVAWFAGAKTPQQGSHYWLLALMTLDLLTVGSQTGNFLPDTPENQVIEPAFLAQIDRHDALTWRVDGAAGMRGYATQLKVSDIYGAGPLVLSTIQGLYELPVDDLWEIACVRYVTTTDELPDGVDALLLGEAVNEVGETYQVYELTNPRPAAHLVYDYRVADNRVFARQIMADNRVVLRELAVTAKPLPFELSGTRPANGVAVELQYHSPEELEITVSTPENTLLTISVPYYEGWQATVNQRDVEILETNAALIGIPLQAGDNQQVMLTYQPRSFELGVALSAITLGIAGIGIVATGWFQRKMASNTESEQTKE